MYTEDTIQIGDIYYSAGPLQHGCIEQWQYTGDRFDKQRFAMKNVFRTAEGAYTLVKYMQSRKGV